MEILFLSGAANSIAPDNLIKHPTGTSISATIPWGIATPEPRAVELKFSRIFKQSTTELELIPSRLSKRSPATAKASPLFLAGLLMAMQSIVKRSLRIFILIR